MNALASEETDLAGVYQRIRTLRALADDAFDAWHRMSLRAGGMVRGAGGGADDDPTITEEEADQALAACPALRDAQERARRALWTEQTLFEAESGLTVSAFERAYSQEWALGLVVPR